MTVEDGHCLVLVEGSRKVRGILEPPGTGSGQLRLLEAVHDLTEESMAANPIRLMSLDDPSGRLGVVLDGFPNLIQMRVPAPPPFPLTITINQMLMGTDDPSVTFGRARLRCPEVLDFFATPEINVKEAITAGPIEHERLSGQFGGADLSVIEITESARDRLTQSVTWNCEIELRGEPRSLPAWSDDLVKVMLLLAFLLDRPLEPSGIVSADLDQENKVEYLVQWQDANAPDSTNLAIQEGQLPDAGFADVVQRWETLWTEIGPFMELVTAFEGRRNALGIDLRFLMLPRMLEMYHSYSDRFESKLFEKAKFREIRADVLDAIPEQHAEHAEWLKNAINEANRKRLSTIVTEILEDLGPEIRSICRIENVDDFVSEIVDSRNFLTHPRTTKKSTVLEGVELFIAVNRLWFVVRACVLRELGFSDDQVAGALERSSLRHYLLEPN